MSDVSSFVHFQIWQTTYTAGYLSCMCDRYRGILDHIYIYGHHDNLLNDKVQYVCCINRRRHVLNVYIDTLVYAKVATHRNWIKGQLSSYKNVLLQKVYYASI